MMLLLSALSVLAAWLLHGVLIAGLLNILQPLEHVRRSLQRIAMGVRAIEQQTAPLGGHIDAVAASLQGAAAAGGALAERLPAIKRDLEAATPALSSRT